MLLEQHDSQMNGFYRSNYTDINGNSKVMLSTQFEALDSRRCLSCIDEPVVSATFGLADSCLKYVNIFRNQGVETNFSVVEISKVPKNSVIGTPQSFLPVNEAENMRADGYSMVNNNVSNYPTVTGAPYQSRRRYSPPSTL